jgi:hypothetical protein
MMKYTVTCKPYALTTVLFFFTLSSALATPPNTVKIFLLGEQSNMVGADKAAKLKSPYNKPFPAIRLWNQKTRKWDALAADVVNSKGSFGPEISFGHTIAKVFPNDDIRLIKYAAAGTALYNDWSPMKRAPQYVTFMATAKSALRSLEDSGTNYRVLGMLWLQGESDANENRNHL